MWYMFSHIFNFSDEIVKQSWILNPVSSGGQAPFHCFLCFSFLTIQHKASNSVHLVCVWTSLPSTQVLLTLKLSVGYATQPSHIIYTWLTDKASNSAHLVCVWTSPPSTQVLLKAFCGLCCPTVQPNNHIIYTWLTDQQPDYQPVNQPVNRWTEQIEAGHSDYLAFISTED